MTLELSPPSCWCDGRCERCPLSTECDSHQRVEALREQHESAGEDPDAMDAVMRDMAESLASAEEMIAAECEALDIDLDDLPPLAPPSTHAARLQEVATQQLMCIRGIIDRLRPDERLLCEAIIQELMQQNMTLGVKAARIAPEMDDAGQFEQGRMFREDTVPSLLLMEHVAETSAEQMAALAVAVPGLNLDRCRPVHAELDALLAPLLQQVPAEDRLAIEALVAAGRAPSPFCTVQEQAPTAG